MRNVGIVHLERKKHQKFKLPMHKNRSADKRVYPASKDRFKKELVLLRVYGYVRVSTKGQAPGTSLDEQTAEILEKYPTAVIVREVASGASERPEFVKICEQLESGDTLAVCKLDRFCRTAKEGLGYISSFVGASEQNTAGCKQAADDALKLFATNEKIKNALRKSASYEPSISPATLETNSVYIYIPDEKLKIYGDLLRIITAQSMEYFSSRPKEHTQMILFCLDEFASFGKLQITEALRKLRKRHIRIMVLTQSLADLDMIYGKDERKAMLGNFKFTVLLGCKDTETQEYFSKMIGEKRSPLETDSSAKPQPIIKPADLAHLEQDLFVICDDGAIRLRKNFYFQ